MQKSKKSNPLYYISSTSVILACPESGVLRLFFGEKPLVTVNGRKVAYEWIISMRIRSKVRNKLIIFIL